MIDIRIKIESNMIEIIYREQVQNIHFIVTTVAAGRKIEMILILKQLWLLLE